MTLDKAKELKQLKFDRPVTGTPYPENFTMPALKESVLYKK